MNIRSDLLGLVALVALRHQVLDLPVRCRRRSLRPARISPALASVLPDPGDDDAGEPGPTPTAPSACHSDNRPPTPPDLVVGAGLALVYRAAGILRRTGYTLSAAKLGDKGPGDDREPHADQ